MMRCACRHSLGRSAAAFLEGALVAEQGFCNNSLFHVTSESSAERREEGVRRRRVVRAGMAAGRKRRASERRLMRIDGSSARSRLQRFPLRSLASASTSASRRQVPLSSPSAPVDDDMEDACSVGASSLRLMPAVFFRSRGLAGVTTRSVAAPSP